MSVATSKFQAIRNRTLEAIITARGGNLLFTDVSIDKVESRGNEVHVNGTYRTGFGLRAESGLFVAVLDEGLNIRSLEFSPRT